MPDPSHHVRLGLIDQRAREVTVFSNGLPDAAHFSRVRERRLNGHVERKLARDLRDAGDSLKDDQLCVRLLEEGVHQPLASGPQSAMAPRTGLPLPFPSVCGLPADHAAIGFIAINAPSTGSAPAEQPAARASSGRGSMDAHTVEAPASHPVRNHLPTSSPPSAQIPRPTSPVVPVKRVKSGGSGITSGPANIPAKRPLSRPPTPIKDDSEGPAPRSPHPAEVPDQDWVIRSVRSQDKIGRYRVAWKSTCEDEKLIYYTKKYGSFVVIAGQRWAIVRRSRQPTRLDEQGRTLQKVRWKDSLFFASEMPNADIQIRRFHMKQQALQDAASRMHKLPRSTVTVEHMADRFLPQSDERLAKARRIVAKQWPYIIPTNAVDLYQPLWEKIQETRLSATRKGKSFAQLLTRKQVRPLRWSQSMIKNGTAYGFGRSCPTYAILLQCTGEEAIVSCEPCAHGLGVFAKCVRDGAMIWGNGACAFCYAKERGTICVLHKDSAHILDGEQHDLHPDNDESHLPLLDLDDSHIRPSRSVKIMPSTELDDDPARRRLSPCCSLADLNDPLSMDDSDSSSESESESESDDDRSLQPESDDDVSGDFGDPSLDGHDRPPPHQLSGVHSSLVSRRKRPLGGASAQSRRHTLAGLPSSSKQVITTRSGIEEIDMTGDEQPTSALPASHRTTKASAGSADISGQDHAASSRSSSPNMARFLAKLPQHEPGSDVDEDLMRRLVDQFVGSGDGSEHSGQPPVLASASQTQGVSRTKTAATTMPGPAPSHSSPIPSAPRQQSRKRRPSSSSTDLYSATPRPANVRQRPAPRPLGTDAPASNNPIAPARAPSAAATVQHGQPINLFDIAARTATIRQPTAPAYSLLTPPSSGSSADAKAGQVASMSDTPKLPKYRHPNCPTNGPCNRPSYGFSTLTDVAPIEPPSETFRNRELTRFHVAYILRATTCEWTKMLRGAWLEEQPHGRYGCIEDLLSALWAEELWHALRTAKALAPSLVDLTMDD